METINTTPENPFMKPRRSHDGDSRVLLGILLIAIGTVLTLENLNIFSDEVSYILISWPMLLITIGLFNLSRKATTPGLILVAIGTYFLLPRMFDIPWYTIRDFWPIIFIILGITFIFRWKKEHTLITDQNNKSDYLDETAIFGGRNMRLNTENFRGGKVTSIFGGSTINLNQCTPVQGCVIDVANIFGGSKIIVPEDWNVKTEVVCILGGFDDKRNKITSAKVDPNKLVIIKGVAIFGGGEVTTL